MGLIRRKKKAEEVIEEPEDIEPAEWEKNIESNATKQLEDAQKRLADMEAQVEEAKATPSESPLKKTTKQEARVRQGVQRSDGVFEWVIESNYIIGNIGEIL